MMYEEISHNILPINMPLFVSESEETSSSKLTIPITITIKNEHGYNMGFKKSRLLVAMIKAFQMAYQDTNITTLNNDKEMDDIAHHCQVPTDSNSLNKYMMDPVLSSTKSYSTNMVIKTNMELKDYLNNTQFWSYITNELINIEFNQLNSPLPYNVGFIEQVTASRETTILHYEHIKQFLENEHDCFQVTLQKLYSGDKSTFVVMVQTEKDNIISMTKKLHSKKKKI
jgi:hypothetical protein